MAAVVSTTPTPHRGHGGPRGRVRADQAGVEPGYQAAISTLWRDRVVASALRRERRVFGLRNAIGA
jgi:hypothetical protein